MRIALALFVMLVPFLILGTVHADLQTAQLKFVTDDNFEPFAYFENGRIKGIDCDIVREMGRRMGVEITIELVPWKRLLFMTAAGDCDGSFSLFKTKEREEFGIFAFPVPLHQSTYNVFVKKGAEFPFCGIWDLYGKRVGKDRGFAISDEFDDAVKRKKFAVEEVELVASNIQKLMADRIDCFVGNYHTTLYYLKKMGLSDRVTLLSRPATERRNCYLVLSKKGPEPNKDLLLEKINETLIQMKMDGVIQKIVNSYLN